MKIHHLNCTSMCSWAGRLAPQLFPGEISCHCLLIETSGGLVLVDSGLGKEDLKNPKRLGLMHHVLGIQSHIPSSALDQVQQLGFSPKDVTHIIPTHLDLDHAGGIADFPHAVVHCLRQEKEHAIHPTTWLEAERYRKCHFSAATKWQLYDQGQGEKWFGFEAVRELPGLPPEILLIPLRGHTVGHTGIAVKAEQGWLLHAGDAFYDEQELLPDGKPLVGWKIFQKIVHADFALAMRNQRRLAELRQEHGASVDVFCAHDMGQYKKLANETRG